MRPISTWNAVPLSIGDKVEIEVLSEGPYDPPASVTRTSESQDNLFSDKDNASAMLNAVHACDKALRGILDKARATEGFEEFHKITLAVASVLTELDRQLISPTLRRHPELLVEAEALKIR